MARLDIHVGDKVFEDWGMKTVLTSEAVAIERAYGKTFAQFTADIDNGSMYALQVLAWSLLRRSDHGLKVDEVDIPIGDITLESIPDPEEAAEESADPFEPGPSETGQDELTTNDLATSETLPTSSI